METKMIHIKATTTREDANRVIEQCRANIRVSVQQELDKYRMQKPICDLSYGLMSVFHENPYDDIINIAHYISNSLADGWLFFFEAERLRRELAEVKGRQIENVVHRVIE